MFAIPAGVYNANSDTGGGNNGFDIGTLSLSSATLSSPTSIVVALNENLDIFSLQHNTNSGFIVMDTVYPDILYNVYNTSGSLAQVTLSVPDISSSAPNGLTVTYAQGGNGSVRDYSSGALMGSNGVGVSTTPTVAPTLSSATQNSSTSITIALSEVADSTSITQSNDGGFIVADTVTPTTTYAVSAIAPGSDNAHVVLTVADTTISIPNGITITYAHTGNGAVKNIYGQYMATDTTGVAIAPVISGPPMTNLWHLASDGTDSIGGADLTLNGSPTFSAGGPTGNSVYWGSNQWGNSGSLGTYQDCTIGFWINFSSVTANKGIFVYGGVEAGQNCIDALQWTANNKIWIRPNIVGSYIYPAVGGGDGSYPSFIFGITPSSGTWYRIVITRARGTGTNGIITTYVNGTQISQGTSISTFDFPGGSIRLGRLGEDDGSDPYPELGYMADAFLYNGIWTSAQVLADYNSYPH